MNNDTNEPIEPNTIQPNQNLQPYPQPTPPSTPSPEPVTQNPGVITPNQSLNPIQTQETPTQSAQLPKPEATNTQNPPTPNSVDSQTPIAPTNQTPEMPVNAPTDQSSTPNEKHHNSSNKKDHEYNSNPFIVAGKGLGAALSENPSSSILIAILPIIIIFPAFLLVGIITGLLSLAGGAIGAILGGLIGLVVIIAVALLFIRIAAGSINILLMSVDKEKITTKSALGSVSSGRLTSFVGVYFLTSLVTFIGFLLFIIPGIYLLARFSLAPVVVYAEDMKAMAAIKRSMALTKGHVFEMLGAISAQSLLSGNGLLSTIGANSGVVKRYKELTDAEKSGITDTGKVHWLNYVMPVFVAIFIAGYISLSALGGLIDQNSTNNFNDFDDGSFTNDDFRFEDFNNSNFNSFESDANNSLEDDVRPDLD